MPSLLSHLREAYLLVRALEKDSIYQLERSCAVFIAWHGHNPKIAELNERLLSQWVQSLEPNYAARTVNKMRADVVGIWQDAADEGLCSAPRRRRIRTLAEPEPDPQIWEPEEVAALVRAAKQLPGYLVMEGKPILRRDYFHDLILTCWYASRRRKELWKIHVSELDGDMLVKRQLKTKRVQVSGLPEWLVDRLVARGVEYPLKWPYWPKSFYHWWEKIKALAGITSEGALQRIRRSAATEVARTNPGAETEFLGHTTPAADCWYVKKTARASKIMPPDLPLTG